MIDQELLSILACPETKQELRNADEDFIGKINGLIVQGRLNNRSKRKVIEQINGGLIRADNQFLYPVRGNIPVLLIEEAIPLDQIFS